MNLKSKIQYWSFALLSSLAVNIQASIDNTEAVNRFIAQMVSKHHFDAKRLQTILQAAEIKPDILKSISSPAESIPWYKYRKIFITDKRIDGGVQFWRENASVLQSVSAKYGVPEAIITAIIGVETHYGDRLGQYRVIDALATLGFAYPKRSVFFLSELENYLLLCREEQLDPLQPTGSYAGAMGLPQFMPSSYRHYAVDFEQDHARDIWKNPADAIASVANYFAKHHWRKDGEIAIPALAEDDHYKSALNTDLKPSLNVKDLQRLHISAVTLPEHDTQVKLLAFEQEQGEDLWLGLHNFYVITRYNHSPLYAMAVYQLAQAIADKIKK